MIALYQRVDNAIVRTNKPIRVGTYLLRTSKQRNIKFLLPYRPKNATNSSTSPTSRKTLQSRISMCHTDLLITNCSCPDKENTRICDAKRNGQRCENLTFALTKQRVGEYCNDHKHNILKMQRATTSTQNRSILSSSSKPASVAIVDKLLEIKGKNQGPSVEGLRVTPKKLVLTQRGISIQQKKKIASEQ